MMTVMTKLEISLNGMRIESEAATLHALLVAQGFALQGAFACAINNRFVPRAQWASRTLQSGDRVDVVSPITGG